MNTFVVIVLLVGVSLVQGQVYAPSAGWQEYVETSSGTSSSSAGYSLIPWGTYIDVNGDGLIDVVYIYYSQDGTWQTQVSLNTGSGWCLHYCDSCYGKPGSTTSNCGYTKIGSNPCGGVTSYCPLSAVGIQSVHTLTSAARYLRSDERVVEKLLESGELRGRLIEGEGPIYL